MLEFGQVNQFVLTKINTFKTELRMDRTVIVLLVCYQLFITSNSFILQTRLSPLTNLHEAIRSNFCQHYSSTQMLMRANEEINKKVVIVGGGILGSSIAYNILNEGDENIDLSVIESKPREAGGGAGGATSKSWAWINANRKTPRHYKELNMMGMKLWQQEPQAVFNGGLLLTDQESADPVADYEDPTYPAASLTNEQLYNMEPNINPEFRASNCYYFAQEGLVDQIRYTEKLWKKTERLGGCFKFGSSVVDVTTEGSKITGVLLDSGEHLSCDTLVLASGTETSGLAEKIGVEVPMLTRPGLLAHTHPLPPLVHRIVIGDDVYFLQRPDGTVVIGDDTTGQGEIGFSESERMEYGRKLLEKAANIVPGLSATTIKSAEIGFRPYPADGLPICGRVSSVEGLYLAVTHSGVTLAPVLSQFISQEIVEDATIKLLEPYRLEGRDFKDTSHTYDIQYCGWKGDTEEAECLLEFADLETQ